ncbi:MAG: phosphoglycerate kinase, partial [Metamycoplasmataceae bacterium]
MKKTIEQINFKNKRVIIRVDFNVPLEGGKITSNSRIAAAIPTLNYILNQEPSKVILLSHLGRVKFKEDFLKKSLRPIAKELSQLLRRKVIFSNTSTGPEVEKKIKELEPGTVLVLENTRFEDVLNNNAESKNDPSLGKYWASLADVFVNDAFGTSHRAHASNVGIANNIKESAIGFLILEELKNLSKAVYHGQKPMVAIIGGAKVSDKIKV